MGIRALDSSLGYQDSLSIIYHFKCSEDWIFFHAEFINKVSMPYKLEAVIETKEVLPESDIEITIMNTSFHFSIISHSLIGKKIDSSRYIIFLAHKSELLRCNINCTIFNKKTLKEIITKVAGSDVKIQIKQDINIELFVQYEESDLEFLNRLLAYYSCFWLCSPKGNIIVTDKILTEKTDLEQANLLRHDRYLTSSKVKVSSYNAKNPSPDALLSEEVGEGKYKQHYFRSFSNNTEGKNIANYIYSQNLDGYNLVQVLNMAELPLVLSKIDFRDEIKDEIIHSIEIKDEHVRLLTSNKMPEIQVVIPNVPPFFRAIVTGEKQLDYEENRTKVLLPFDNKKPVFATIMQSVCAKNNQSFIAPAKNDEVIVSFLDNNLTSLVIMGSFFNVANKPVFSHNEFGYVFSNEKGESKFLLNNLDSHTNINVHNQGDFQMECGGNISIINKKGDVVVEVEEGSFRLEGKKGNMMIKIEGNQIINVSEKIELHCKQFLINSEEVHLSSKKSFSIEADSVSITAKSNYEVKTEEYKITNGSSSLEVKDSAIEIKSNMVEIKSGNTMKISGTQVQIESQAEMNLKALSILLDATSVMIKGSATFSSAVLISGALTAAAGITTPTLTAAALHGVLGIISG
jgi:phage baseplate assembly protein gpV